MTPIEEGAGQMQDSVDSSSGSGQLDYNALLQKANRAERRAVMFGDVIATHTIAMQAAVIDAYQDGPEAGMRWIRNTLRGPGFLPKVGDWNGTAQDWFDKQMAEHEAFRAAHPGPVDQAAGDSGRINKTDPGSPQ